MDNEIITALLEWNPWIEGEFPDSLLGIDRQYNIVSYLSIPEIKILEGVRRSGKSTLLYQVIRHVTQQGKNVLYVNFDDEILRQHSLSDIYYAFLQKAPIDYLFIDEVQWCDDWVPFVRKFYDRKQLKQIWITGSNTSPIKKEYAELLTGRNIKLTISLLSFCEYLPFKKIYGAKLPISKKRESQIKELFNRYLNTGAFPAIASRTIYQRELLNNYFEDFLYKDIATRHDVNISKLKNLTIYLITNSTKLFSYRKVANLLGLHQNTVNDYISYMKDIFLFNEIHKFDYSLKIQYSHQKKIYAIDTGLANTVSFRFSENKGQMLETLIYNHLKRKGYEVYFHLGLKECDFLIKEELDITQAIQVSCSLADPKTKQREIDGLAEAIAIYQPKHAFIITLDEEDVFELTIENKTHKITVMPAWKWMLDT